MTTKQKTQSQSGHPTTTWLVVISLRPITDHTRTSSCSGENTRSFAVHCSLRSSRLLKGRLHEQRAQLSMLSSRLSGLSSAGWAAAGLGQVADDPSPAPLAEAEVVAVDEDTTTAVARWTTETVSRGGKSAIPLAENGKESMLNWRRGTGFFKVFF